MRASRFALATLLALAFAGPAAASDSNCGCGPKAIPEVRAEQFYQMALKSSDPDTQRRLAETALRIDPDNAGAKALIETLDQSAPSQ